MVQVLPKKAKTPTIQLHPSGGWRPLCTEKQNKPVPADSSQSWHEACCRAVELAETCDGLADGSAVADLAKVGVVAAVAAGFVTAVAVGNVRVDVGGMLAAGAAAKFLAAGHPAAAAALAPVVAAVVALESAAAPVALAAVEPKGTQGKMISKSKFPQEYCRE